MAGFKSTNEKMVETELRGEEMYARVGAMVAFTGDVAFARSFLAGGGVQNMAMRAATNEGIALMSASGTGTVYYAHQGKFITVITLQGDTLCIEAGTVLAFDSKLRAGTMFLGNGGLRSMVSGMAAGQGLFTSTFEGHGQVAILSDGNAIGLDVTPAKPVCVDPQAYLGHRGQLTSAIITDVSWKNLIGQASGESYQMKFTGTGTVYIQASER